MKRGPDIDFVIPDQLNLTTYYLEENLAQGRADKTAIYYEGRTFTFGDMVTMTNKIGNVLKDFGVTLEDRCLLVLQDSPEWVASWFAIMKIGAVATHAYTYLQPSDYEYFLNYVRPRIVIVDSTTIDLVREGVKNSKFPRGVLVAGEDLPELAKGEYSLNELVRTADSHLDAEATGKNDTAFWNFSGGTTGKPKGVPHMHHDGIIGFESYQYVMRLTPDDVVLRIPKLFFHYARDLGMNWPLKAGAAVALSRERTTADLVFESIERYRPTILVNVPTMMRAMLRSPKAKGADLSCVRICLASGEALSAELYKEFTDTFRIEVLNVIGSAEAYMGYFMDLPGQVIPGSSGKITPLCEAKLVDDQGNEVPEGETGVLWVRSDSSGWMYHQDHEKTKSTFVGRDWVNTNDLFREDENGYWWYMGRADDLIKVSGVYVAPFEIEKCLEGHKAVRECVVLGVKDADGLAKTKAFIVLKEGYEASEAMVQELKDFCRQKMASFKSPRLIKFVTELPKTGQGKIDKRALIAQNP
jgi:benzoate-CoA ligase family protein